MPLRRPDGPLTVQVPSPRQDRPSWIGVGAVAVAGFVVGVAWPRLTGVRLGPSVPDSPAASASETEPAPAVTPSQPRVPPSVPAALPSPVASASVAASPVASSPSVPSSQPSAAAPAPPAGQHVSVARGAIFSCKTAGGQSLKGAECGALPGLDKLVLPRLRKLADCPDAAGSSGTVHFVVRVDFPRNALAVESGRDRSAAAPLLGCAKSALSSVSLEGMPHDNARYGVAYVVTFSGPAAAEPGPAAPPPPAPAAEGTAQVEWGVAIVRDAPKTGKVIARLQRGTAVHIGIAKDGWYPVKYGDGFASDGWVYGGAIGR